MLGTGFPKKLALSKESIAVNCEDRRLPLPISFCSEIGRGCRLELEAKLAGERSATGFRCDLTKRTGVDVQIGVAGCWMVEDVPGVDSERQASRFSNPELVLQVSIEVPTTRSVDGIQP